MGAAAHKRWSEDEIAYLDEHRWSVQAKDIAIHLGRSVQSVRGRMFKDYARRRYAHIPRARVEPEMEFVPPPYVLHEREIRRSIPRTTVTQVIFADPVEGYSALDTKVRKISVQDAIEICALYTGKRGEVVALAGTYGISPFFVQQILSGSFFDRLAPLALSGKARDYD